MSEKTRAYGVMITVGIVASLPVSIVVRTITDNHAVDMLARCLAIGLTIYAISRSNASLRREADRQPEWKKRSGRVVGVVLLAATALYASGLLLDTDVLTMAGLGVAALCFLGWAVVLVRHQRSDRLGEPVSAAVLGVLAMLSIFTVNELLQGTLPTLR